VCFRYAGPQDTAIFPLVIANSKEAAERCKRLVWPTELNSFGVMVDVLPADQFKALMAKADDFLAVNLVKADKSSHNGFDVFVIGKRRRGFLSYKQMETLIDSLLQVTKDKDLRSDLSELRSQAERQ